MPGVLIIGSGLAGMSAAVRLCDAGIPVTVLEANPYIGGRTASWNQEGMDIETGLHRFLGFYTALPDLLEHVGIRLDEILCWEDEIEIRTIDRHYATLGLAPLHEPFKTAWGAIGHRDWLPLTERPAIAAMFAAGLKDYKQKPDELDKITVAEYAKKHKVSDRALHNLLTPLTEGIFFVPPESYSMHNLIGLFAPYITSLHKLRVGAFLGGMSQVMMQPMADYVQAHGGKIVTGSPVDALLTDNGCVIGAISNGVEYRADQVILATSLHSAQSLISKALPDHPHFMDMQLLPTMPAVTFQIELSEPSMELDRTTFGPLTILASFAEQSRTTFQSSKGRLSIILANPDKYLDAEPDDILEVIKADLRRLGLDITDTVKEFRKVRLPHDFYSLATGSEHLRPAQETPVPGLTLAGDYTKQQYLATMEGAVVSGRIAAEIVGKVMNKAVSDANS